MLKQKVGACNLQAVSENKLQTASWPNCTAITTQMSNIVPHRFFLLVMASGRGPLSLCCCFCCCRFRSLHRYYLHCSKPEFTSVPPYGFSLLCNERITDLLCKHLEILPLKFRDMPDNTINKTRPPPPPNKLFI